jgi:uncharacterized membrane protein
MSKPPRQVASKPLRIARAHSKLLVSAAVGFILYFVLPDDVPATTRLLISWNVGVGLYIAMALYVIVRSDVAHLRRRAAMEDEGAALILFLTVLAAAASVAAIFAELGTVKDEKLSGLYAAHAIVTVILSWAFIHLIFAFHYAHEFYGEAKNGHNGGLDFPGAKQPDYWDFIYFSFVIGMTFQVSDVQVTSKVVRMLVVGHGAVSFFFNVAVLALMVNIGGNFIK